MRNETITIKTSSENETQKLGMWFASMLKGGEVLALKGNLGSGKTVFVRGLAQGFGIKKKITSPTFVLVKPYQFKKRNGNTLYHFDLYRLKNSGELKELGFSEIVNDKKSISVVEWPEKANALLPKGTIVVELRAPKNKQINKRTIKIWSKK